MIAEQIISIVFVTFESIVIIVLLIFYLLDRRLIRVYKEYIHQQNGLVDETLRYCLTHILSEAVENQDFECAKNCKELLDKLPETKLSK